MNKKNRNIGVILAAVLVLSGIAGCGLGEFPPVLPGQGAAGTSTAVSTEVSAGTSTEVSASTSAEVSVSTTTEISASTSSEVSTETSAGNEWIIPENDGEEVFFNTTDRDGNIFTEEVFANAKITMINMWEPWCGPCVSEMPDLQRLYEDYWEDGLLILGVYSSTNMESDVDYILDMTGAEYPILLMPEELTRWQTGYVPTTIFVDGNGRVIDFGVSDGPQIVGAHSYEDWEELIRYYLER